MSAHAGGAATGSQDYRACVNSRGASSHHVLLLDDPSVLARYELQRMPASTTRRPGCTTELRGLFASGAATACDCGANPALLAKQEPGKVSRLCGFRSRNISSRHLCRVLFGKQSRIGSRNRKPCSATAKARRNSVVQTRSARKSKLASAAYSYRANTLDHQSKTW